MGIWHVDEGISSLVDVPSGALRKVRASTGDESLRQGESKVTDMEVDDESFK